MRNYTTNQEKVKWMYWKNKKTKNRQLNNLTSGLPESSKQNLDDSKNESPRQGEGQ